MKILYIGSDSSASTSLHRADALRRLGHDVFHLNPRTPLRNWSMVYPLSVRVGFGMFAPIINYYIKKRCKGIRFDLAWLDTGAELGPSLHKWLCKRGIKLINYNVDDPFSTRDGHKWDLYRKSVAYQDLTVVVRSENVSEAEAVGAKKVIRVFRSYDPVVHAPVEPTSEEKKKWASEVSFIGTWMPERGPFMQRLIELGVPLLIRGNRWQKAPEWSGIQSVWAGPAVYGRDYILALQCSKVTLGLLSVGNRDLHTQRSAEVPFIGGAAFCAERTPEHASMYEEGSEVALWSSPEECAQRCFDLLEDADKRQKMVAAAKVKVIASGLSNDAVMEHILNQLD